jgi:predicted transposase YbfD/YdcC
VFATLGRTAFAACFSRWAAGLCTACGLRPVSIDGKAVRAAAGDTFNGCLHLVTAWAGENHRVLGQEAVADGSHEIAAIPALLQVLELKGALVTIDAAGGQVEIARAIRAKTGPSLLPGRAKALGRFVRGHWAIENGLHWVLDVAFREDANRTRDKNAGANLGIVRRLAAALLKQMPERGSIHAKRLNAALDHEYLLNVLRGFQGNLMRWPWIAGRLCLPVLGCHCTGT